MKANLVLFSLFLLVSIMTCNVFVFSISGDGSEASYEEAEKAPAMTTTHFTKIQPLQAILSKMKGDAPPLSLIEKVPPSFPTKASYLIHPVR